MTLPGRRLARVLARIRFLAGCCAPRVQAAYLRLVCDGWCTRCQFQGGGACLFGCDGHEDSVAHFARCPAVRRLFHTRAGLAGSTSADALDLFLGFTGSEGEARQRAWATYALYRVHNARRTGSLPLANVDGAFRMALQEAARNL